MKTLADVKRRAKVGSSITMVFNDWYPKGKLIGVKRKITRVSAGEILISDPRDDTSSSLAWPLARNFRVTGANTFSVWLNSEGTQAMGYRFEEVE